MTRHAASHQPQLGLDETLVEISELEEALEARLAAKVAAGFARKAYKEAHAAAQAEIEKLELPDGKAIRAGRFRISRAAVSARSVTFETNPTTRVTITFLGEEEADTDASVDATVNGDDAPPSRPDPTHIDSLRNRAADARQGDAPPTVHQ